MTWEKLLAGEKFLKNMVQFRWLETSTSSSSSQLEELRMDQMIDQDSSWMKMMSNKECILSMILIKKLFLWIFWEYILILSKIMLGYRSQLSKLSCFYFCEVLVVFCCANCSWIDAFRRGTYLNLLDDCLDNWSTWMNKNMVYPSWFQV